MRRLENNAERTAEEDGELLLAKLSLACIDLEEAQATAATLEVSAELAAKIQGAIVSLEVAALLELVTSVEETNALRDEFVEMAAAGRVPTLPGMPTARFWLAVSQHAETESDVALFSTCVERIKAALENNPKYASTFKQLDQKLAKLQKQ